MNIDSYTQLTGLFGHPIEHSLSPLFVNFVYTQLHINSRYIAFDISPDNIKEAVEALKILNFRGLNITIPLKQAVISSLDTLSEDAKSIRAVNCIVNKGNVLCGYNTDYLGFIKPLEDRKCSIKGSEALLIGCGGAARSVLFALVKRGVKKIHIVNRTEKNAFDFMSWSKEAFHFNCFSYAGDGNAVSQCIVNNTKLIINTTPVGMYPDIYASPLHEDIYFHNGQLIYDLIYNPVKTELLKKAEGGGAISINGFEMLILQGLYSCALWFPEKEKEIFSIQGKVFKYVYSHKKLLK